MKRDFREEPLRLLFVSVPFENFSSPTTHSLIPQTLCPSYAKHPPTRITACFGGWKFLLSFRVVCSLFTPKQCEIPFIDVQTILLHNSSRCFLTKDDSFFWMCFSSDLSYLQFPYSLPVHFSSGSSRKRILSHLEDVIFHCYLSATFMSPVTRGFVFILLILIMK